MIESFNDNGDSYRGSIIWLTPPSIINFLGGKFDLDPCACEKFPNNCAINYFTEKDNGLNKSWKGYKDVFCNPPYDYISLREYTKKCIEKKDAIMLIYARTDTELFQNYIFPNADSIFFIKGRLKFLDKNGIESKNAAGAPSCLISFSKNMTKRFLLNNIIKGKLINLK